MMKAMQPTSKIPIFNEIKHQFSEYSLHDQYNTNETGLFYNIPPNSTIARNAIEDNYKILNRLYQDLRYK